MTGRPFRQARQRSPKCHGGRSSGAPSTIWLRVRTSARHPFVFGRRKLRTAAHPGAIFRARERGPASPSSTSPLRGGRREAPGGGSVTETRTPSRNADAFRPPLRGEVGRSGFWRQPSPAFVARNRLLACFVRCAHRFPPPQGGGWAAEGDLLQTPLAGGGARRPVRRLTNKTGPRVRGDERNFWTASRGNTWRRFSFERRTHHTSCALPS